MWLVYVIYDWCGYYILYILCLCDTVYSILCMVYIVYRDFLAVVSCPIFMHVFGCKVGIGDLFLCGFLDLSGELFIMILKWYQNDITFLFCHGTNVISKNKQKSLLQNIFTDPIFGIHFTFSSDFCIWFHLANLHKYSNCVTMLLIYWGYNRHGAICTFVECVNV